MAMTLEEIVEETRRMPPDVVAELVDRILLAQHGGIEADVESAWRIEVTRRIEELKNGTAQGVALEDSLARARKIVGL